MKNQPKNGLKTISIKVKVSSRDNLRLDKYLAIMYPRSSRSEWKNRISKKEVLVNQKTASASKVLHFGDSVEFKYEKSIEPDVNKEYSIVYENKDILVIDKPANLPVHPSGPYYDNTLLEILKLDLNSSDLYLVHRLDRVTSGLICIAKTLFAARHLSLQLQKQMITKKYFAVVAGKFPTRYSAKGFIGLAGSEVKKRKCYISEEHPQPKGFKTSRTDFRNIKTNGRFSLLLVRLFTGRTHQIRATLDSIGYPIVGDMLYGGDETIYLRFIYDNLTQQDMQRLIIDRLALHCCRLKLINPSDNKNIKFYSALPKDLKRLV